MNFISRFNLFFNTIQFLKPVQLRYRAFYFLRNKLHKNLYDHKTIPKALLIQFNDCIKNTKSNTGRLSFNFLNLTHDFSKNIDWNFNKYGKLWTYNLNYFDFLKQKNLTKEQGLLLIHDYIKCNKVLRDGLEPYPTSLRTMNWCKFLSQHRISDKSIETILFNDYQRLYDNIEYHLLGNHLLENGFSLLFGSFYFNDKRLYMRALKILSKELEEQILADGGHFELSPMYHQIILERLLDCYYLLSNNERDFENISDLSNLILQKVKLMLGWLETFTFNNGDIPLVNDASRNIASSTHELFKYARTIDISWKSNDLKESGYRKYSNSNYEVLIDVGKIGPDYQPGHAHADSLNFLIHYNNKPFIIDRGVSTYENNDQRAIERSTMAHNTVMINQKDSSEVWGGFRVGQRSNVAIKEESNESINASLFCFFDKSIIHNRKFEFENGGVLIEDQISNANHSMAYFHFDSSITIRQENDVNFIFNNGARLKFNNSLEANIVPYQQAIGFNKLEKSLRIEVLFKQNLITEINL